MSIDYKTLFTILPHVFEAKFPVLLRGRHGIGKSTVVYQQAKALGLPVVERRASQMTEGDLLGLPKIDGNVTAWLAPEWLDTACRTPVVLFLDEVDRATLEVRQGIFELCDSRKIAGHKLHPDTLIFACVNGGKHGAEYQVNEFDPAELDRYTVSDVEPTVEDWLEWAKGNVIDEVWDFINHNHNHLEHKDTFEPNKIYPSRRSWERLSNALQSVGEVKHSPTLYHLAHSFIGFEGAMALNDYIKNYSKVVTPEQILDEGRIDLTKNFKINDHNSLLEKFKAKKSFEKEMPISQLQNIAEYFITLPSEIAMTLWKIMGASPEGTKNIPKMCPLKTKSGVTMNDFMVSILTAGQ